MIILLRIPEIPEIPEFEVEPPIQSIWFFGISGISGIIYPYLPINFSSSAFKLNYKHEHFKLLKNSFIVLSTVKNSMNVNRLFFNGIEDYIVTNY